MSISETRTEHKRSLFSRLSAGHVVMIVAGLLAALVNFNLIQQRDETFQVAVAEQDIIPGQTVSVGDFDTAEIKASEDLLATLVLFSEVESLSGMVAVRSLSGGELISRSDVQAPAAAFQQRAMSIPIDPDDAVGGKIAEADLVDIIHVEDGVARYVAVAVSVLAVAENNDGFASSNSFYVTVAVDAELALKISSALDSGTVRLVRSTGADQPVILEFDPSAESEELDAETPEESADG